MTRSSIFRKAALAGALVSALTVGGATFAATSNTDRPSSTPDVSAGAHAIAVSAAAASDLTGGPHNNHGGYVSCVARGGSNCTTTTPTLPTHGQGASHSQASSHGAPATPSH